MRAPSRRVQRWLRERPGQRGPRRRKTSRGLWRLRRPRPRQAGRPPLLPRPLRAAAPRPGVGRHRDLRRAGHHRREGHGARLRRVRRPHPRRARGRPRGRPHPLLHDRLVEVAERPAHLPRHGPDPFRPRPQRQPDQHRGAGSPGRDVRRSGRLRHRRGGRADRPGAPLARPLGGGRARCGRAEAGGRLLVRAVRHLEGDRGPRPQRLPTALPGAPRRRVGAGVGVTGARHRGGALRT